MSSKLCVLSSISSLSIFSKSISILLDSISVLKSAFKSFSLVDSKSRLFNKSSNFCISLDSVFSYPFVCKSRSSIFTVVFGFSRFCNSFKSFLESFVSFDIILSKALFKAALSSSKASSKVFAVTLSCVACLLSVSSSPLKSIESISFSMFVFGGNLFVCACKSISFSKISSNSFLFICSWLFAFDFIVSLVSISSLFFCAVSLCVSKDSKSISFSSFIKSLFNSCSVSLESLVSRLSLFIASPKVSIFKSFSSNDSVSLISTFS